MIDHLRLYAALVAADLRSQMQYRFSFITAIFGDLVLVFLALGPIYFMMQRFGVLKGWSFAELALLYGMVSFSWGLVELAMQGFENFGNLLVKGQLDAWLVRPRPLLLQMAAIDVRLRRAGHVAQSAVVAGIAIAYLKLGPAAIGWVVLGMAGGSAFFAGVLLLGAASQFWTLGHTAELQNMLTYGGSAILTYPVSIYSRGLQRAMIYGVPLAFVNYFPALAALGRLAASGHAAFMPWLSPFACGCVLGLGLWAFRAGVRRYESSGS